MNHEGAKENIQAYALGALDTDEAAEVRTHLRSCEECRGDLESYLSVRDALNVGVPECDLPRGFHSRLVSRTAPVPMERHVRSRRHRVLSVLPWGLAVASLLAAFVLGGRLWQVSGQLTQQQSYDANMSTLMARKDLIAVSLNTSTENAKARVYMSPDRGTGVLMVSHLPHLSSGKVYQLWLIAPNERHSVTTFRPLQGGAMRFYLYPADGLQEYNRIEITISPEGGSSAPTQNRVVAGEL